MGRVPGPGPAGQGGHAAGRVGALLWAVVEAAGRHTERELAGAPNGTHGDPVGAAAVAFGDGLGALGGQGLVWKWVWGFLEGGGKG